jgi:hypothetical protein
MLIHKTALIAGALAISTVGAMAQGTDLGARAVVVDSLNNQRALQEQAEYRAYRSQFESPRPSDALNPPRAMITQVSQRDAITIARTQGMSDVDDIQPNPGGWMVDGTDAYGQNLIVQVGYRGEVLDVRH